MIAQVVWIYLGVSIDCLHIWHFQGEGMTSIEPTGGRINDICVFSGTGLLLVALDSSQIPSYFIPALGPAPKWCSYLENLTVWLNFLFCHFQNMLLIHLFGFNHWRVFFGFLFTGRDGGGCTNNYLWWFQVFDKRRSWEVESDSFDRNKPLKSLYAWLLCWLPPV